MMPSSQFLHLSPEKQEQIVTASLREFAARGYDLASTNRIVNQAGISKGVLFKYFDDKESLFIYTCDVCARAYIDTLPREPMSDLFEFLRSITVRKFQFMRERPLTTQLFWRITKDQKHPVHAKVLSLISGLTQHVGDELPSLLPADPLRPGLTWQHVLNLVTWMANGLQEKFFASASDHMDENWEQDFQRLVDEFNLYLDIIQTGIYVEARQS